VDMAFEEMGLFGAPLRQTMNLALIVKYVGRALDCAP